MRKQWIPDHLPVTVCLMYEGCTQDQSSNAQWQLRVDWEQAQRSGLLEDFTAEVQAGLALRGEGKTTSGCEEESEILCCSGREVAYPEEGQDVCI